MKELNLRLKKTDGSSMFHDSRADSAMFMEVINAIHDKVNGLIRENNELKERVGRLERMWRNIS